MRVGGSGQVIWSASDVKKASECEFAWMRALDAKLGRIDAVDEPEDAMLRRAINRGLEHEHRVLDNYLRSETGLVVQIPDVSLASSEERERAVAQTVAALADPNVSVIYQGAFVADDFVGYADFMVSTPEGWVVQDTKLARTARVTALMQLAAYVDQLNRLGVNVAPKVELILGSGETSVHRVEDLLPVFHGRRDRIRQLIADRAPSRGAAFEALGWGDARGQLDVFACGRCETCEAEVVANRDLLLIAGMRPTLRGHFLRAGIRTIDELAVAEQPPTDVAMEVFVNLRIQARLQVESTDAMPRYQVVLPSALSILPAADPGDIFFDFEGDPLYTEKDSSQWGIDYLFGWVDSADTYTALWAHSFAEEREALLKFLEVLRAIRAAHPHMHVYHYAPYEPAHLAAMAARHGVGEAEVDRLLADGVFVDLYPIVKRALRVGSRSYSIKKLEPLYMGEQVRTEAVQNGADSIEEYVQARALMSEGRQREARVVLDDLAAYNTYDCVSTRRLRDWLASLATKANVRPIAGAEPSEEQRYQPDPLAVALLQEADTLHERREPDAEPTAEETALRLTAAAVGYHQREHRAYWAEHFLRLREPLSLWSNDRNVFTVDRDRSRIETGWYESGRQATLWREVFLAGELSPGSSLSEGAEVFAVYERPVPFPARPSSRWINVPLPARIIEIRSDGVLVAERGFEGANWSVMPLAITQGAPPHTKGIEARISEWARLVLQSAPVFRADAPGDVLLRRKPRTRTGGLAAVTEQVNTVDAIVRSVRDLDNSYVAVQGPPGTGKTYVGAHVIARLVAEQGYRVGVVAQSHAVVENLLERVVLAGLDRTRVGKATASGDQDDDRSFTWVKRDRIAAFRQERNDTGYVLGGTAWDFCNDRRFEKGSLDLLVIDEAGQYSLALTVAVSSAARNLLLLGDPQQLPQVSQGTHPEPVDMSALGWIMNGADVIDADHGYFLAESWRMRPEVSAVVSRLSYQGQLVSAASTTERSIEGVQPGVHAVPVPHRGNTSHSQEEADRIVELAQDLVGRRWTPGDGIVPRPLVPSDLIVVTPYNAQQQLVRAALDEAGFTEAAVGTVDKFQGQEAAVAIVTLAASSARDAPRGLEFLLLANRLNVAISRAQVAAFVVYAPQLLQDLPRTPEGVARLSAFQRVVHNPTP